MLDEDISFLLIIQGELEELGLVLLLWLLIGVVFGAHSFCWRPAYSDVDLAFVSGLCNNIIYTSAKLSYYCGKRQGNSITSV